MGWQSYVIPYETDAQKETILDVIKKHNSTGFSGEFVRYGPTDEYVQLEGGEELGGVQLGKFKANKAFKNPRNGPALPNVILCGHGGGRGVTFHFLDWELRRALPDIYVNGEHAIQAYGFDHALDQKLVKRTAADDVPYERVAADDRYFGYDVRPVKFVTRVRSQYFNPEYRDLFPGLYGNARKRRINEMENPPPPYTISYETTTDGSVSVRDLRFPASELERAKAYSEEMKAMVGTRLSNELLTRRAVEEDYLAKVHAQARKAASDELRERRYGAVMDKFIDAPPITGDDAKGAACVFAFTINPFDEAKPFKCPYDVKVAAEGEPQTPFCSMCLQMVEKARAARS